MCRGLSDDLKKALSSSKEDYVTDSSPCGNDLGQGRAGFDDVKPALVVTACHRVTASASMWPSLALSPPNGTTSTLQLSRARKSASR